MPKARLIAVSLISLLAIYLIGSQFSFFKSSVIVSSSHTSNLNNNSAKETQPHNIKKKTQTFITGLENLPRSFVNTQIDGQFKINKDGELLITEDIIQIFDYFFTALGDESEEQVIARIQAYIHNQLQEPARFQALKLLESVVATKKELAQLDEQVFISNLENEQTDDFSVQALRQKKNQIHNIRLKHLPLEAVDTFYGDEYIYDNYSLKRMELMRDSNLNPLDKSQKLAQLKQQLPEKMRESINKSHQITELETLTQQLKEQGGSAEEIKQLHINLIGEQAANRLAKVEQQQKQWQTRVDNWLTVREQIKSQSNIDKASINAQIESLRDERFSKLEAKRIQSLERIYDQDKAEDNNKTDSELIKGKIN